MYGDGQFNNGFGSSDNLLGGDPFGLTDEFDQLDREMRLDELDMKDELTIEAIEIDIESHTLNIRRHRLTQAELRMQRSDAVMSASPFAHKVQGEELVALVIEGYDIDIRHEELKMQQHRHEIRLVRRTGKLRRVDENDVVEKARQQRNITATRLDIDNIELELARVSERRSAHEEKVVQATTSNPLSTLIGMLLGKTLRGESPAFVGFDLQADPSHFGFGRS